MMGQRSGGHRRLFYSFNLDDHIPSDHLLGGIDRFLDFGELRHHLAPGGAPIIKTFQNGYRPNQCT